MIADPNVPPNWRWERARSLAEDGYRRHPLDDGYIDVARRYQVEADSCETDEDRQMLRERYPGICDAAQIYFKANAMRWALEAFLLSRAEFALIAGLHRIHKAVVTWYAKLFYDVLPHLESESYILSAAIGDNVHNGLTDRDYPLVWKIVGFYGGPLLLRSYIRPFHSIHIADEDQVDAGYLAALDRQMRKKALAAGLTVPTYGNHQVIFDAYHKGRELADAKGGGNAQEQSCKENIYAAMLAFKDCFLVGSQPCNLPLLEKYRKSRVELRPHELMQAALGTETEEMKQTLNWKFPDEETASSPKDQEGGA